jgi:hypothetical protein
MIGLTLRSRQKREVSLSFLPKTFHMIRKCAVMKGIAKFSCAFSAIALSYAVRFRQKWGMIEIWNIWETWQKMFENLSYTVFGIIIN